MLQKIQTNIELAIYGYEPNEFIPVLVDGELDNKPAFIAYKAKRALGHFGLTHDNIVAFGNRIDDLFTAQRLV